MNGGDKHEHQEDTALARDRVSTVQQGRHLIGGEGFS